MKTYRNFSPHGRAWDRNICEDVEKLWSAPLPDYDFRTLSPSDFELLTRDLLRSQVDTDFESFGHGPDGGVDLRSTKNGRLVVVQCKHYRGSTFSQLKRSLNAEKAKMDRLRPNGYFFVTSQDLSLTQKDTIKSALQPHIADTSMILGMRDLNQILADHPEVEINHFKLWMASSEVLRQIVQSGLWERSTALMEEIQDRVRLYVPTRSFAEARRMLEANNVCVLTGAPGVGKSMLADMLALTNWEDGWQIVTLGSHEIDKSWDAWVQDKKQLFYFDDVFGQTDIQERLGNDSGATLARLIRRVGKSAGKRLVVTSRTHVLNEAELRDELVERSGLRTRECVVQVTEYSALHRARILYNHLYFSNLPRKLVQGFLASRIHWTVIGHANFTPRLIEQSILLEELDSDALGLAARMLKVLDEPVLLWGPSFREALTEQARLVLMHLAAFPVRGASLHELRAASMRAAVTPLEYQRAITQLEGSWIKVHTQVDLGTSASFHDPSCRDFVLTFLESEPDYFADVLEYATDAVQIAQMLGYSRATIMIMNSKPTQELKYPQMNARTRSDIARIADLVRAAWRNGSATQDFLATETLGSLAALNDHYRMGLDEWLVETILGLGSALQRAPDVDNASAATLAQILMESDASLTTAEHFDSCRRLFASWCDAPIEEEEWDELAKFSYWVEEHDFETPGRVLLIGADFVNSFTLWLDNEWDALKENVGDYSDGDAWLDSLEAVSRKYLSSDDVTSRFNYYRDWMRDQWLDYEPHDYEDFAGHSRGGDVVERASTIEFVATAPDGQPVAPLRSPVIGHSAVIQERMTIESMFTQLHETPVEPSATPPRAT